MGQLRVEVRAWWERKSAVNWKCQLNAHGSRRRKQTCENQAIELLLQRTHHTDTRYAIATLRRLCEHDVCFVLAKVVLHLLGRRSVRHGVSSRCMIVAGG